MITFQKLSAKHYRGDEFNYIDVFKLFQISGYYISMKFRADSC